MQQAGIIASGTMESARQFAPAAAATSKSGDFRVKTKRNVRDDCAKSRNDENSGKNRNAPVAVENGDSEQCR